MEWKIDVIEQQFIERDLKCILAIPISARGGANDYMWSYSKDGSYMVKPAYMLGNRGNIDDFHGAWVDLWKLGISPKACYFL